ncbi:MAG: bis(5'-nucleosyl)-tetraphosphatase (symmetrical) YqeK [Spirochaetes bacterium]|nr:bis(5'-nucleosyl)-tetraphosphatase (symmetrical) YqeK [Spirochaetota bacterium]
MLDDAPSRESTPAALTEAFLEDPAILRLSEAVASSLSPGRLRHSEGTARTAAGFAYRLGLDPWKAFYAGLAHDMCKEFDPGAQAGLAREYHGELPDAVFANGKLPHGPAAAVRLARDFGMYDPEILEAVAYHTIGRRNMGDLALAVYCADKVEPGRRDVPGSVLSACATAGIVEMGFIVVGDLIRWYLERGVRVAPETVFLYNDLLSRLGVQ